MSYAFRVAAASAAVVALMVVAPARADGPTVGGVTSGPVEYVTTVPVDAGAASSARVVGDYLYLANWTHISIYDVSDPLAPAIVSATPFGASPLAMEDLDTNGEILVFSEELTTGLLHVWDVSDKANPTELATLDGAGDHTITCVLDCTWVYGSYPGHSIVDLRDPANPRLAGSWASQLFVDHTHDITEVAPGRVVTASRPTIYFLNARRDPTRPRLLASGPTEALQLEGNRILSSTKWARGGRDKFLLVAGETPFSGQCTEQSAALMTWDATKWRSTRTFTLIDQLRMTNGTFTDGGPPANLIGCSSSFFDPHPRWRNGGLIAAAFFDHGTRFVTADAKGQLSEVGWFLPYGGETLASFWVTDEIVYAIDQVRGIDILRYTRDA